MRPECDLYKLGFGKRLKRLILRCRPAHLMAESAYAGSTLTYRGGESPDAFQGTQWLFLVSQTSSVVFEFVNVGAPRAALKRWWILDGLTPR